MLLVCSLNLLINTSYMKIQYYWTWAALNPNVDTTHFQISDGVNVLHVDAGAWMSLTQKILREEIEYPKYIFMTHCHSDHLLWLAHLIRIIGNNNIVILASISLKEKVKVMMYLIGKWEWFDSKVENWNIEFKIIKEWESLTIYDRVLTPINLYSKKTEQFWFQLKTKDNHIVFFWDEAVDVMNRSDLSSFEWCDWLLCETFCTMDQVDKMQPYSKAHIASHDAGKIWTRLKAKNLVLSHIAEVHGVSRDIQCEQVKKESSSFYDWNVVVPSDWEVILF